MKIVDHDGDALVSTFSVEPFEGATSVTLASAGGTAAKHYPTALRLLVERLAAVDARLVDAFVDSHDTRRKGLTREQTRLHLRGDRSYPLRVAADDPEQLRLAIGAAQEPIGQEPGDEGGNRNKRIRLLVEPTSDPFPVDLEGFLSAGSTTPPEIEDVLNTAEAAAGKQPGRRRFRQSAGERRAIELRAMDVAEEYLTELGCAQFENVSAHESYDLRCRLDGQEVHVEVKGTTSEGARVLLTRNEVAHAREYHPNVALVVVSGITLTARGDDARADGGQPCAILPWELLDDALEPIAYECIVPPAPD
jgi:hypothetical protein